MSRIKVDFTEPLDARAITTSAAYLLMVAGPDGDFGTADEVIVYLDYLGDDIYNVNPQLVDASGRPNGTFRNVAIATEELSRYQQILSSSLVCRISCGAPVRRSKSHMARPASRLSISNAEGARHATISIDFDRNLLGITRATVGANTSPGATVDVDNSNAGRAIISFTRPSDLPASSNTLVDLQATVPTANASAIYRRQHVLDITVNSLTNSAGAQLPAIDNDAVHMVLGRCDWPIAVHLR